MNRQTSRPLTLVDESMPTRKAKPAGLLGAKVWVRLVAPSPADAPADSPIFASPASLRVLAALE